MGHEAEMLPHELPALAHNGRQGLDTAVPQLPFHPESPSRVPGAVLLSRWYVVKGIWRCRGLC